MKQQRVSAQTPTEEKKTKEEEEVVEQQQQQAEKIRVGWVSTYGTKCGIGTYSQFLMRELVGDRDHIDLTVFATELEPESPHMISEQSVPDYPHVVRCWQDRNSQIFAAAPSLDALYAAMHARNLHVAVLQFHYGFFGYAEFAGLLDRLHADGVRTIVTVHNSKDVRFVGDRGAVSSLKNILGTLRRCHRILVHDRDDWLIRELGSELVRFFPHGALDLPPEPIEAAKAKLGYRHGEDIIVATYGVLTQRKGLEQLIEAFPTVLQEFPRARLLFVTAASPAPDGGDILGLILQSVVQHNLVDKVRIHTEWLDDEQSVSLLAAADLLVFPYINHSINNVEGASGAVKVAVAAHRPIAVTPSPMFYDMNGVLGQFTTFEVADIAGGIVFALRDAELRDELVRRQDEWLKDNNWSALGRKLRDDVLLAAASRKRT